MASSRSQTVRQSLQLSIDPSPYDVIHHLATSPESFSPESSARASIASVATSNTTPSSGGSESTIYSVLCLYDFESADPDLLCFSKNEILDVVKQEDTGWWAAMRPRGNKVGWIPQAFVKPLTDEMSERLRNVREELRVFEYEAEELYNSAPISHHYDLRSPSPTLDDTASASGGSRVR